MGFLTGEKASINGWSCLRRWRIQHTSPAVGGVCSSSDGGPHLLAGNEDWKGVARGVNYPTVDPGDTFTFNGEIGSDVAGPDSVASGAIVDRVRLYWNVEAGEILFYDIWFSGVGQTGALTMAGTTGSTDGGTISPVSTKDMQFYIDGKINIRSAWLEVAKQNAMYVDSATAGRVGRVAGTPSGRFWVDMYFSTMGDLSSIGTFADVRGYVNTAEDSYYQLQYGLIEDVTPEIITETDQAGRPQGNHAIIQGSFSGWSGSTQGQIVTPNSTGDPNPKLWD